MFTDLMGKFRSQRRTSGWRGRSQRTLYLYLFSLKAFIIEDTQITEDTISPTGGSVTATGGGRTDVLCPAVACRLLAHMLRDGP